MKISEEDKKFVLKVEKIFPEVWVYLQREANRGTRWADLILCLQELQKVGNEITVPWGFLEWKLREIERKREQKRVDERTEEWEQTKIQSEEDLKNWLRGVGK